MESNWWLACCLYMNNSLETFNSNAEVACNVWRLLWLSPRLLFCSLTRTRITGCHGDCWATAGCGEYSSCRPVCILVLWKFECHGLNRSANILHTAKILPLCNKTMQLLENICASRLSGINCFSALVDEDERESCGKMGNKSSWRNWSA